MSLLDTIKQFNWLDIFVVIFLFRIGYIALKNGFPQELFKVLGSGLALYISLHFYTPLANYFAGFFGKRGGAAAGLALETAVFIFLAIAGYLLFVLLRMVFCRFIMLEATPQLNKWGGFVLGMFRSWVMLGIIFFALALAPVKYLNHSVKYSYFGKPIINSAVNVYRVIWDGLISKFAAQERFNSSVLIVEENIK